MLTLTLSKTAQQQSSSVVSNRSTALITNKFSVALLTELAILNNANITLVDAVIDALTITLIKNDDDLLGTVNSYIKPPLKRRKTKAADSRYAKASRGRTKKDKDLEDSDTSSDVLRLRRRDRAAASQLKKTRDEEELAKAKKEKEEKESLCKSRDSNRTLHSRRLTDAYILYFKELLSNNGGIFANAIGIGKTRAIVLAVLIRHCDLSDPLALQFCFFSNSPPENIGRLTKEEAIEMQIDTTNAISKALAAANKLTIPEANTPAVHPKATKHCPAPSAAQFIIVCGFRKVDKHIFRAYNTMSVTAQRTIIRKGGPHIEKRAILLPSHVTVWGQTIFDKFYNCKLEGTIIANIKSDFLPYFQSCLCLDFLSTVQNAKQQCRDILEKEGLNKSEASRRVIFNCFEMQAIASYSALATLKAAQFKTYGSCKVKRFTSNSVKDLFTNLSKDYFLVREARAITKSSPKFQNLSNLCSKLAEMCVSIVYFNLDSELELKVLGKQDVKTTSRDKLQGRGSTVTDQRID
ncbi:hypothetical protein HBI88_251990 [Parastagonospora nodorum]|nr:hypothetical protein HBI97_252620 [Parastagonospora nodorum]KAH5781784.1 hypothetical protein HBI96_251370 [Parastagonospora nodorum]KAH5794574.1 hypothetical protein HBI94_253100 [Parastagonospora nodorum]KAH5805428.1 hypothetical protein HBI93_252440 [Parastagonospora nodorum]KAH5844029.1 hypothetical protein HBI91_253270 [Parastagonospora nodorum]